MKKTFESQKTSEHYVFDFVIVGGSPGGLSAALMAGWSAGSDFPRKGGARGQTYFSVFSLLE